jgi:hypothetical protein
MHSEWSDGAPTLTEIVEACLARRYSFAAVTDHSHGLRVAGGMSMTEAAEQHAAIDGINASGSSFWGAVKVGTAVAPASGNSGIPQSAELQLPHHNESEGPRAFRPAAYQRDLPRKSADRARLVVFLAHDPGSAGWRYGSGRTPAVSHCQLRFATCSFDVTGVLGA